LNGNKMKGGGKENLLVRERNKEGGWGRSGGGCRGSMTKW